MQDQKAVIVIQPRPSQSDYLQGMLILDKIQERIKHETILDDDVSDN